MAYGSFYNAIRLNATTASENGVMYYHKEVLCKEGEIAMDDWVLALDQGTTKVHALSFLTIRGVLQAVISVKFRQIYPAAWLGGV